jgi:hypothetical protein
VASDGHVAHSGIAKAPTRVQDLGESVRCLVDGGAESPKPQGRARHVP